MKTNYCITLFTALIFALGFNSCKPSNSKQAQNSCEDTLTVTTPSEAIATLIAGNKRYTSGQAIHPRNDQKRIQETAPHQTPFAAVVGCSDSRVPVELLFDQGIGDIFVIRTAGNNVNSETVMGSIEYAVEHLNVKLLLVLGHGSCGGVSGAISATEEAGSVGKLLTTIRQDISEYVGKPDSLDVAIQRHTHIQVDRILNNPHIAQKVKQGKLLVKSAHYDVKNGKVSIQ